MAGIRFTLKGNFNNTERFFKSAQKLDEKTRVLLDKYGKEGVAILSKATPTRTGKTAESWSYKVSEKGIVWTNSNIPEGGRVSVAILLQYGHATGTGGYVQGRDYINPAVAPLFDKFVEELSEEVKSL